MNFSNIKVIFILAKLIEVCEVVIAMKSGSAKVELTGVTWDHPRGYDPVVAASELYAKRTGTKITWHKRSLQAFADEPVADLANQYDFIVLDHPHVGKIAETGALMPLPGADDEQASLGGSAESYIWNDECWAYPIDAACQMAAYRPDLNPPLPQTWEDLLSENTARYRPITPLLPVDAFDMMMSIVAGRGREFIPVNCDQLVCRGDGAYALNIMRHLYHSGPCEQLDMNPIDVLEVLSSEDEFACSPCLFGYANYTRPGFRTHRISYFDLPLCEGSSRPRAILGGAGIGVSAKTRHPEEATRFARWITSRPVQSGIYLQNNGQPAHRSTWIEQQDNPDSAGFYKGGFHTIDNAWTRPRDAWFLGFVDDVCEIFPDFFRKNLPVDLFLDRLNGVFRHHFTGR